MFFSSFSCKSNLLSLVTIKSWEVLGEATVTWVDPSVLKIRVELRARA